MTAGVKRIVLAGAQLMVVVAVLAAVVHLSQWPRIHPVPAGTAVMKLSFSHAAERGSNCRRLSPEEIARLPSNMRRVVDCPRGRPPVFVEMTIDGTLAYAASLPPSGFSGDGPSRVYRRFVVPAGAHKIVLAMRDTARSYGFDHTREAVVDLAAGRNFVIDFRPADGGFVFN